MSMLVQMGQAHMPQMVAWQRETWCETRQRYQTMQHVIGVRLLAALRADGYARDYVPTISHRHWTARAPLDSTSGAIWELKCDSMLALHIDRYRRDRRIPTRRLACLVLLGLAEDTPSDGPRVRSHSKLTETASLRVHGWYEVIMAETGARVSYARIVTLQLVRLLDEHGIHVPIDPSRPWVSLTATRMVAHPDERVGRHAYYVPGRLQEPIAQLGTHLGLDIDRIGALVSELLMRVDGLHEMLLASAHRAARKMDPRARARARAQAKAVDAITLDIYSQRFLKLCKERAARDAWHRKGGVGKPPVSTVDDHLGRTVHGPNADRIAADRVSRHADMREHKQDVARRSVR